MTALLFSFALWMGFLALEAYRLRRWRRAIPVRIAVTGTRGKSSVAGMLAAVLREDGWRVLAKTTGAEPVMLLPDGSRRRVARRGGASILEQVGLVGLGARLGVDALVAEVMSVRAEYRWIECRRILDPHLVLVTNFRVDHLEAQGGTKAEVARVLSLDVPDGARVLVPREEWEDGFSVGVRARGASLQAVPREPPGELAGPGIHPSNLALVRAAAELLGVEGGAVERGLRWAAGELGSLRAWSYPLPDRSSGLPVVSAFAANDPESTLLALGALEEWAAGSGPEGSGKPHGLLALRADRGDRSALWAEALAGGALNRFSTLHVHGLHAYALARRLRGMEGARVEVVGTRKPDRVMARVTALRREGGGGAGFLFGFGNMGGLGERMVRHWQECGRPLDLTGGR